MEVIRKVSERLGNFIYGLKWVFLVGGWSGGFRGVSV